jgi:hypothetical protein
MHRLRVEAIIDREIAGERVENTLLGLNRNQVHPLIRILHSTVCTPTLAPQSIATTPSLNGNICGAA